MCKDFCHKSGFGSGSPVYGMTGNVDYGMTYLYSENNLEGNFYGDHSEDCFKVEMKYCGEVVLSAQTAEKQSSDLLLLLKNNHDANSKNIEINNISNAAFQRKCKYNPISEKYEREVIQAEVKSDEVIPGMSLEAVIKTNGNHILKIRNINPHDGKYGLKIYFDDKEVFSSGNLDKEFYVLQKVSSFSDKIKPFIVSVYKPGEWEGILEKSLKKDKE